MPTKTALSADVLGKLLLIQGTIHIMPDKEKLTDFLRKGLATVPGIAASGVCLEGKQYFSALPEIPLTEACHTCKMRHFTHQSDTSSNTPCALNGRGNLVALEIRTSVVHYGFIIIAVDNWESFSLYRPYIETKANHVALLVENRNQNEELETHRKHLENKIAERTQKLRVEIQERRLAEKRLRDREKLLRTIYNAAVNISFVTTDLNKESSRILSFSPGSELLFGYREEEIVGKLVASLHSARYADLLPVMQDELASDQATSGCEMQLVRKGGEVVHALVTQHPLYSDDVTITGMLELAVDVSALKKTESELAERNRFIESLLNLSPDIIYIFDLVENKNCYSNKGVENVLGYSVEEIQQLGNRLVSQLMHPEDYKNYLTTTLHRYTHAKDNEPIIHQYRMHHKDGSWHWLYCSELIYKRNNEGIPIELFGVIHDITEQKRTEDDLLTYKEIVHQCEKMQAVGQLAGGVAHDFNNQLAGIVGYAELLREDLSENSVLVSYVDSILLSTHRASGLTRQLLAFARKGKQQALPVDMHKIIREVVAILQCTVDRRICINLDLEATLTTISGEASQIQNVIMNIALNARDAIKDGGKLLFATKNRFFDAQSSTVPGALNPGRYLAIEVSDNGSGMSEDTMKKVFEPFFTTKEPGKGTGMGLAVAYGTVKNHGGAIEVKSVVGTGTTISILLPVINSSSLPESEVIKPAIPTTGEAHILLVEDEEIIIDTTIMMLERSGYTVTVCRNGADAVAFYQKNLNTIDLVILDMVMPIMNGQEAFGAMMLANPAVKVLLSSGYSIDGEAQKLLKSGACGFIQKPYRREELMEKLRAILTPSDTNGV